MNLDIAMDGFAANLLLRQTMASEVLDERNNVLFRRVSGRRQHRVVVVDTNNVDAFFVNLDDIQKVSPYLAHKLATNTEAGSGPFNCGLMYKEIGVQEFEFLLGIICPYEFGLYPEKVHAGSLARSLTLGIKFQIPDLVVQCRRLVMETDISTISTRTATRWFEAMERSGVDEVFSSDGRIQRPGRSHMIASMMNGKRWQCFREQINIEYSRALQSRAFRHRCDFIMAGLPGPECNCKDLCGRDTSCGLVCQLCSRRVCFACSKKVACAYEVDVALSEYIDKPVQLCIQQYRRPSTCAGSDCGSSFSW